MMEHPSKFDDAPCRFRCRDEHWVVFGIIALLIACGLIAVFFWFQSGFRFAGFAMRTAVPPPKISLSAIVDGHTVSDKRINVTPDSVVIPRIDIDWGNNRKQDVTITLNGKPVDADKALPPLTLSSQGFFTLEATATSPHGATSDSILFEVTTHPRRKVNVTLERLEFLETGVEVDVRLSSNEFDIKNIYLSHVSLWLLDQSNLDLARLPVPSVGNGEPDYNATYQGESWLIHFSGPALSSVPQKFMLTGTGWEDLHYVEFATAPIPINLATSE